MRKGIQGIAVVIGLLWANVVAAQEVIPAEPDIEATIGAQIDAFQADDFAKAFTYASPKIQGIFGTAQNFGTMVRQGYPMVWRPARYEMLQLVETSSGPVQVVLFEDAAGVLHEAGYLMALVDGVWRIAGVHIRKRPGVGT